MVVADRAWHDDATVEREQAHAVQAALERVKPLVVGDGAMRPEDAALALVAAVDLADLRDGAYRVLGREAEAVAQLTVMGALEADPVALFPSKALSASHEQASFTRRMVASKRSRSSGETSNFTVGTSSRP